MWTPTALASKACRRSGTAWRVVEFQHTAATRKVVDTKSDQELLEDILEATKPPVALDTEDLHYLLKTPFRYNAPYPVGSRFRRAGSTEGVFYGSKRVRTALAELCYFRLRFYNESPDTLLPRHQEQLTVFSVGYSTGLGIDLTQPPFVKDRTIWTDPSAYEKTQTFADSAREAGIQLILYESVRDVDYGLNLALLSPTAFKSKEPITTQTWFFYLSEVEANFERANANRHDEQWTFKRDQFSI